MFNHWAIGLRSGLLPQVVVLQHQKVAQKRTKFERSFREGFDFWCQGMDFRRVLVGSRRCPASFLQGLAPQGSGGRRVITENLSKKVGNLVRAEFS